MSDDVKVFMQGLGGAVWEMTLPLHPVMQKQVATGDLRQVNEDGSDYDGPRLLNRDGSVYEEEPDEDDADGRVDVGDGPDPGAKAPAPPPAGKASK